VSDTLTAVRHNVGRSSDITSDSRYVSSGDSADFGAGFDPNLIPNGNALRVRAGRGILAGADEVTRILYGLAELVAGVDLYELALVERILDDDRFEP